MSEIDLRKCLTSGQVFRWTYNESEEGFQRAGMPAVRGAGKDACAPSGHWHGVDGATYFCLSPNDIFHGQSEEGKQALHRLFRLDWNYAEIASELTRNDPEMERLLTQAQGLRMMRPSCPRETLFSFLCTSNNHISRITQMVDKLAAYGAPLADFQGQTRWPSTERIAEIGESELRQKGFGYRAATIPKVAQSILVRGGDRWFDDLRAQPYPEVFDELVTLPGVGPKLADCIALYAFDKTEATPTDTHLWQAVTRIYFQEWRGSALTDAKRRHVGSFLRDRFGPYAGLAQQLLFFDNLLLGGGRAGPRPQNPAA